MFPNSFHVQEREGERKLTGEREREREKKTAKNILFQLDQHGDWRRQFFRTIKPINKSDWKLETCSRKNRTDNKFQFVLYFIFFSVLSHKHRRTHLFSVCVCSAGTLIL